MARMVWALFCEQHISASDGKSSYINVFDTMTAGIMVKKGKTIPTSPLPGPIPSLPFTLALQLGTKATSPTCVARLRDPDDQQILPEIKLKLKHNPDGRHRLHLHFPKGIPITKSGIYTFEIGVEGETLRPDRVDLPVTVGISKGGIK